MREISIYGPNDREVADDVIATKRKKKADLRVAEKLGPPEIAARNNMQRPQLIFLPTSLIQWLLQGRRFAHYLGRLSL